MGVRKWLKNIVKGTYRQLKKLKVVRRLRYSNFGWKIYFVLFPKIRRITDGEYDLYASLSKEVKGNLAFDIGANRGINTSHLLKLGYEVVAVEPEAQNFEALSIRYKGNPKVHLINAAISKAKGEQSLFIETGDSLHSLSSKWRKVAEGRFAFNVEYQKMQTVSTLTLDDLIKEYGMPHFLKVDVEGHELEVFSGLSHAIPMIIFEANLPEFLGETEEIMGKLKKVSEDYQFKYYAEGKFSTLTTIDLKEMVERKSIECICQLVMNLDKLLSDNRLLER